MPDRNRWGEEVCMRKERRAWRGGVRV